MAFTDTVVGRTVLGNMRFVYGRFDNAVADSGGDIETGLSQIIAHGLTVTSHVGSTDPKATVSLGTITVVTNDAIDGLWWAIGK
jgi:hypothetical protein